MHPSLLTVECDEASEESSSFSTFDHLSRLFFAWSLRATESDQRCTVSDEPISACSAGSEPGPVDGDGAEFELRDDAVSRFLTLLRIATIYVLK